MNFDRLEEHTLQEIQRYQKALELAGVGMWEVDTIEQKVYLDKRSKECYGFSEDEQVSYHNLLKYIHPGDLERVTEVISQASQTTQAHPLDMHFRTLSYTNTLRWVHVKGNVYAGDLVKGSRIEGIVTDVSEQIELREQFTKQGLRAEQALEGASAGWFTLERNSDKIDYSATIARIMTGSEQIVSRSILIEHIHPEDLPLWNLAYEQAAITGKLHYQIRFVWDDGSVHWIRVMGTYGYDEEGEPYLFSGIAQETTQEVESRLELKVSEERFRSVVEQAPMGIGLLRGREMRIEIVNDKLVELWGKDDSILGMPLQQALPELEGQPFMTLLEQVYDTGKPVTGRGIVANLQRNGRLEEAYFDFAYTPLRYADGTISGVMVLGTEVTTQVLSQKAIEASEAKFRSLIEETPFATALYRGEELIIDVANPAMIKLWGKDERVRGMRLADALPELESQPFLDILAQIYKTGEVYHAREMRADLVVGGKLNSFYFNFTYKPLRDEKGQVYAILNMAVDVTNEVLYRKSLEESELFSKSIIFNSPVAKMVVTGKQMIIHTVNENMLQMIGRDKSIVGQPFMDVMQELEATPLFNRLQHVYTTGQTFHEPEEKFELLRFGKPYTGYYQYTYKALSNVEGQIYGIIIAAIEVTNLVVARKKVEEAEALMRGAIELAQLGTWTYDPVTNRTTYSDRLREWFGILPEEEDLDDVYPVLSNADQERIRTAMAWALNPESGGVYNEEYEMTNRTTGQKYIIHAQARTFFDEQGKPVKMFGTAQDVTERRSAQLVLEQQVHKRTEELAKTNQELFEANQLLVRSNDNLEKFAYIASHDLQEPLRKIQSFGDMLKKQYGVGLGEGLPLLERMQAASKRMSVLIHDLLAFSKISNQKDRTESVSLNQVLDTVLNELEFRIQETQATIQIAPLPVVQGDATQLGQLFLNLFSNALKFSKAGIAPVIKVEYALMAAADLSTSLRIPHHSSFYHRIEVKDNGIGFEQEYAERIFQIFQRLHSRVEYAGTGIGLAICEKVVANHKGAIQATSTLGQGAVFTVFLPVS
ncbi:PAS domain-containing protein [Cytophagaceae bacterium DM2B3-1]|uniref:histidine kinase n=1 Tax=Xanthocytophaga flava TaxID=3048013 RepID=A0ABT7D1C3_9BACT|nr:PAS domain-containing protein [Xanthocytophaga flavus]MDJ1498967.1 PAS domain-containing protein [Xanthocytophaga flavus]